MDAFIIIIYALCDDHIYGYQKDVKSVCGSFEEAKTMIDKLIIEDKYNGKYNGRDKNPFIEIIRMEMGDTKSEILYTTDQDGA